MFGKDKDYITIKESLIAMRRACTRQINENEMPSEPEESSDAVPYTSQDELYNDILSTAKSQFGADFSNVKEPMKYYPSDGDVILFGEIPSLNSAKFQFRYRGDTENCFLWGSPLRLTDDNMKTLNKLYGVYKNWKKELDGVEDRKPMSYRDSDEPIKPKNRNAENGKNEKPMVPGDDID